MTRRRERTALARALVLAVTAASILAGCGQSAPVEVNELAEGDQATDLDLGVDGPVQVNFRSITLEPGASTGEHCHHGQLVAVVEEGTLTHYADVHPGGVREYAEGESVVEGAGYVHEGRNEGDSDVVLWVMYATEEGEPLAQTDLQHCDK